MPQLAIYITDELARALDAASHKAGLSRSAWVRRAVQERLAGQLPASFFEALGSWDDPREADEILRDIRDVDAPQEREPLD